MAETKKQKTKKIRLSIPLSEDIYNKIEKDAEIVGVSMATYGAMIIGNHYKSQQISLDYANKNMTEAFRSIFEPLFELKGLKYDEIAEKMKNEAVDKTLEAIPQIISEKNK